MTTEDDGYKVEREIVDKCNELAHHFYGMHGNERPPEFKFYDARHPQESLMWHLAAAAYDWVEGTDVEDILDQMRSEGLL